MARRQGQRFALGLGACGLLSLAVACGEDSGSDGGGDSDAGAAGTVPGVGGDGASGGTAGLASGGQSGTGGAAGSGVGGDGTSGGASGSGSGGQPATGGAAGSGGDVTSGGTAGLGSGGQPVSGGASGSDSGGAPGVGGGAVAGAGGEPGSGGSSAGAAGAAGAPPGSGGGSGGTPAVGGAGGSADVAAPELLLTLYDRWEEGWLGSPAIVDLESDGSTEIVVPRADKLYAFNPDASIKWKLEGFPGRIWASPIVADFVGDGELEVVFASREQVVMVDADGNTLPGFPVSWEDELRSIAAGDVDDDGQLDIVVASTRSDGNEDVVNVFDADGNPLAGFPPLQSGVSGCEVDDRCYIAGAYDQNVGVGDVDDDGVSDIVVPMDNAYAGFYRGTGEVFDTDTSFPSAKVLGMRYLHDLSLSQLGYPTSPDTDLQAHFTNTPPAIADLDQDGTNEIVMLASVQNGSQTDRLQGVALWVMRHDTTRFPGFETPFYAPDYLAGLWDLGNNIVGITCQASVADIDPTSAGLEIVFPGFDGRIHAVQADGVESWSYAYTTLDTVLTGGVVIGDLSGDGSPEIVFNTYSTNDDESALIILDARGGLQQSIPLPRRGAMAVPTLGDVNGDGQLEIVVSLKDAEDRVESVLVYTVPGSNDNYLPWPTGRGSLLRDGRVESG